MKNFKFLLSVFSAFFCSTTFAGGGSSVKNGGDLIFCDPRNEYELNGYYFLDLAAAFSEPTARFRMSNAGELISDNDTTNDPLEHVKTVLGKIDPYLLEDFTNFVYLFNKSYKTGESIDSRYNWVKTKKPLEEIDDENYPAGFEMICRGGHFNVAHGEYSKEQLVVRSVRPDKIIKLEYNEVFLNFIYDQKIQMSFFLVHEWLWNFSPNALVSRAVNAFIHSDVPLTMGRQELLEELAYLGLEELDF